MSSDKKKILVIINSELYIRNYIKNNIFGNLNKNYNIYFLVNKNIKNKKEIKKLNNFIGYYSYSKKSEVLHSRNFNTIMWRFRKISKSFEYRIKWFSEINFFENKKSIKFFSKKILKIINVFKFRLYIQFFGSKIIFPFYKLLFIDNLKVNLKLKKKISYLKPDLVILPTQSQTPCDTDVVRICKSKNITTLYLVDNWDNLSDKSKMLFRPDYISVWGEQTKRHAVEIQGFNKKQIFILGTPRFESYFQKRFSRLNKNFNFKYILFLGTALEFDEISIVKEIDNILSLAPFSNNIKLIYRPHPWRMSNKKIDLKNLKNVFIDPQVEKNYIKNKMNLSFQPELSYYPSLIKNSEFVIGGLTSMIIESLIFYKKYIITAMPEKKFNNQYNSLKYHVHFKELKNVKNIIVCNNLLNLKNDIIRTYHLRKNYNKNRTDLDRNFFLFKNNKDFKYNLEIILDKIFKNV